MKLSSWLEMLKEIAVLTNSYPPRRIADALNKARIQVRGLRFTVPKSAELAIEHEAEDGEEELELQLKWST